MDKDWRDGWKAEDWEKWIHTYGRQQNDREEWLYMGKTTDWDRLMHAYREDSRLGKIVCMHMVTY